MLLCRFPYGLAVRGEAGDVCVKSDAVGMLLD